MKILFSFIMLLLLVSACNVRESLSGTFYYNSFEESEDIGRWAGINPGMIVHDSSPGSGKKALLVKSENKTSSVSHKIRIDEDGNYAVYFWGRTNSDGGTICIRNGNKLFNEEKYIMVAVKKWEYYASDEIFCASGSYMSIEVLLSEDTNSDILLDGIKIKKL